MLCMLLFIVVSNAVDESSLMIVFSEFTPSELISHYSQYQNSINIDENFSYENLKKFDSSSIDLIIDLTLHQRYFFKLNYISNYFSTIYLTITPKTDNLAASTRFFVHGDPSFESSKIKTLADYLKWETFGIISSETIENMDIAQSIYSSSNATSLIYFDVRMSEETISNIIKKQIKSTGLRKLLILAEGEALTKFENGIRSQNLHGKGSFFIIKGSGVYSASLEGSLILSEPNTQNCSSETEYEISRISEIISKLKKNVRNIEEVCPNNLCLASYEILNIQAGKKVSIGIILNEINVSKQIIFPGNVTSTTSPGEKSKIRLSIANGTSEIYNFGNFPTFAYWYQGANYAKSMSDALNEIPNFEIEFFPTNCGNAVYDENWYNYCFSNIAHEMGLGYLTGIWPSGAMGNLLALRKVGKKIAQISPYAQDVKLENKTQMPEIAKLTLAFDELIAISFSMYFAFNWRNFIMIFSDDTTYQPMFNQILPYMTSMGVKIWNYDDMILKANYTRKDFEAYRSYFEKLKSYKCRLYAIFSTAAPYILEALYDIGLRQGEIILISDQLILENFKKTDENDTFLYKREVIANRGFTFQTEEFVGEFGQKIYNQLSNIFPYTQFMGLTFDTFFIFKETFKFLITKGDDYEDYEKILNTIRNIKVSGCSGSLSFSPDTNNRANIKFSWVQVVKNDTTQEYFFNKVFFVDRYNMKSFIVVNPIDWPTESSETPLDMIKEGKCPFKDREIRDSNKGKIVIYVLSCFFLILVTLTSFWSYKKYSTPIVLLAETRIISLSDYLFFFFFVIEFFQILTIGPDQQAYKYLMQNFQILVSMDFMMYYQVDFDTFWLVYYISMAIAFIGVFSNLAFCIGPLLRRTNLGAKIKDLLEASFIIASHFMFLPTFSMLMNIYDCRKSIGSSIQDTFLYRDCTTFCYTSDHKSIMIVSTLLIAGYLLTSSLNRPQYEKVQKVLNISTKASYLAVLNVFQVTLVVINKCIKITNQSVAGLTQSGTILIMIGLTVLMKPYNYKRAEIAQITTLTMALWGVFISSIIEDSDLIKMLIAIEFSGFALVFVVGIIFIAKAPALLVSEEPQIKISEWFMFQFFNDSKIFYQISRIPSSD